MNQCLCTGCSGVDCTATTQSICGTTLGKQKFRKIAGRCHWCQLPSSPDDLSSRPHLPFSATASTQSILYPLDLFGPDGGERFPLIATKNGSIPRTRHASGPCWEAHLGPMKNVVSDLHKRSAPHGWNLIYWSHEAMDATMKGVADYRLRCCYFAINPEYRAARSDLFRFWLMFSRGGVWLDLRGNVSEDPSGLGLEALVKHLNLANGRLVPDFFLIYGGQHKEKFHNEYGEILNGFLMSAPGLPIWKQVIDYICGLIESYPQRWKDSAVVNQVHAVVDSTRQHYTADCVLSGREGVLCLGPLAMTRVIMPHLKKHDIVSVHLSKDIKKCIDFDSFPKISKKKGSWSKAQAKLFWKDPQLAAQHRHYSDLCGPIVNLAFAARLPPVFFPPPSAVPISIRVAAGQAVADGNSIPLLSTAEASAASRTLRSTNRVQSMVGSFSRSRSRGARCNLCQNSHRKLSVCVQCGDHGCKSCSFWCTLCSRKGRSYFICGRCHHSYTYLTEVQARKVWACRSCRK
jgi:hypothetical protein